MTHPSDLVELRERVRRAGDRLPDGDLAMLLCALNGEKVRRFDINCGDDGSPEFSVRGTGGYTFNEYRRSCPDVSIDAALALCERVLPGWTIGSMSQQDDKTWVCELREGHLTSYNRVAISESRYGQRPRLLALAILDAALTALSQSTETGA